MTLNPYTQKSVSRAGFGGLENRELFASALKAHTFESPLSRPMQSFETLSLKSVSSAFRPGVGGEENREVFESALKSVDATFQNLDSSEISLTDVSHYFDSDPTKLVSGLRTDGKLPSSYIADTTTANAQVRFALCMPFYICC